MGFIISGQATSVVTTPEVAGDSNAQNTTLLLSGNGSNNATNNTFVDSSTNNFAITRAGNTTQGTFTPYGDNWSNYFDGSGDYLTAPSNAAYQFGTGDFTIEYWIYQTASGSYRTVLDTRASGTASPWACLINSNNQPYILINSDLTSSIAININAWNHVAIVRSGTNLSIYVNGVSGLSTTNSTNISPTGSLRVGFTVDTVYPMIGYLSNIRIVKGTAVYTSAFTPPTTPLTAITNTSLLTCQSNRFKDNSTNNFAITKNGDTQVQRFSPFAPSAAYSAGTTGGSAYFDGANDYLLAASASVTLPGNFTVECWIYPTSFTAVPCSAYINYGTYVTGGFAFNSVYGAYNGSLWFYSNARGPMITSTINTVLNAWNHIAVVRSGSTLTMYINGQSAGTASGITETFTTGSTGIFVGNDVSSEYAFGYISDARIATSAVYTGAFTPPTAPLTAISGTQFLANMTNGGITDSSMINNLETVGDAKISTTQSKFGGSSMAFDGTGDYLAASPNVTNNLGTSDFTIEAWIYLTSSSTYQFLIGSSNNVSGYMMVGLNVPLSPTSTIALGKSGQTWPVQFGAGTTFTSNTWTHIAITRSGTTNRAFINGVQLGSNVTDSTNWTFPSDTMWIGNQSGGNSLNGYIDDLRITKGLARYTTTFTPPTAALTAVATIPGTSTTTNIASGMTMSGTGSGMIISSI